MRTHASTTEGMFRGMGRGLVGGLLVLLFCASAVRAQELRGEWSGTVTQDPPGSQGATYPARMVLNGPTGTMAYDSLHCGGTLTLINKRGNIYFYRETITWGRDKCIDNGTVAVEPNGNTVQWAWSGSGYSASALLTGVRRIQSCAECSAARERCFAGCDSLATLPEKAACVNRCNAEYPCVMGDDCK